MNTKTATISSSPNRDAVNVWGLYIHDSGPEFEAGMPLGEGLGLRDAKTRAEQVLARNGYKVAGWHGMTAELATK